MPFFTNGEAAELLSQLNKIPVPYNEHNIYHSNIYNDYELESLFDRLINNYVNSCFYRLPFSEKYKIVLSVYINKKPSQDSSFDIHTDDSLCDERFFAPLNIWIPLIDVNLHNGTICINEGTHKKTLLLRSNTIADPYILKNKKTLLKSSIPMEIKIGTALLYNPSCVHFSPPNKSASDRPVIATTLIPENADLCIFTKQDYFLQKSKICKYNLTREQFMKKINLSEITPSEIIKP